MTSTDTDNSHDFLTDNDSEDATYEPNESDYGGTSIDDSAQSITDVTFENGIVDETALSDLSLKTISKTKSNSKVWDSYGTLLYKQKIISKVANKVYCKFCFNNGCLKR